MQIGGEGIEIFIVNIVLDLFFWKDNMKKHLYVPLYLGMD
jgi:hypothetical protein